MPPFNGSPSPGNGDLKINNQDFQYVGEMKSEKVEDTLVPATQVPQSYDLIQDRETGALAGVLPEGHLEQEKYTETFDRLKELTNGLIDINYFLGRKSFLTPEEIKEAGLVLDTMRDKYQEAEAMMGSDPFGDDKRYMEGLEHDGLVQSAEGISKELFSILTTTIDYEVGDVNENCDIKYYTQYRWFVNDKEEIDSKEQYLGGVYIYKHGDHGMSKEEEYLEESVSLFEKKKMAALKAIETVGALVDSSKARKEETERVRNLRALYHAVIKSLPSPEIVVQSKDLFNLVNSILPKFEKNYTYSNGMYKVSDDNVLVSELQDLNLKGYKSKLGELIDDANGRLDDRFS